MGHFTHPRVSRGIELWCVCVASVGQDNSGMGRGEQGMEYHKKVPLTGNDGEV